MGKEADLWDDSALINAFDKAISKYKKMHSPEYQLNPSEDDKVGSSDNETGPDVVDDARILELEGNSSSVSYNAAETYAQHDDARASGELPFTQENHLKAEMSASQPYVDCSSALPVQETVGGYSDVHGEEYKKLLGQYYELEEQRQRVLLQLHQASGWNNYQSFTACSGSCLPCYICCDNYQANQVPAHDTSFPAHMSSCCPYCNYLAAPATLTPACVLGGQYMPNGGIRNTTTSRATDPVKLSPVSDDSIVKMAMGAAEKAIASIKAEASETSDINQGEVKGKTQNSSTQDVRVSPNVSSQTDLTEVLKAWYSAGFYTGKYLVGQSLAKGQP